MKHIVFEFNQLKKGLSLMNKRLSSGKIVVKTKYFTRKIINERKVLLLFSIGQDGTTVLAWCLKNIKSSPNMF